MNLINKKKEFSKDLNKNKCKLSFSEMLSIRGGDEEKGGRILL